jgi:integrase
MKFTRKAIEELTFPESASGKTQCLVFADEPKGLGIRITPNNKKTFILEYKINGRNKRMTLGGFPMLTVDQAKSLVKVNFGKIAAGEDPVEEKKLAKVKAMSVRDLAEIYFKDHIDVNRSDRGKKDVRDDFDRYIFPVIGQLPLDKLNQRSIGELFKSLKDRHRTYNICRSYLKTMFAMGVKKAWLSMNPMDDINKMQEQSREIWIKEGDFKKIYQEICLFQNPYLSAFFKSLMLTAARSSEVQFMKWDDLDFENQIWTIPETKNGTSHEVHICKSLMSLLKTLPVVLGNPYVFVGEVEGQPYNAVKKAWQRMRSKLGLEKYTIHDIRRTMATYLAQNGTPRDRIAQVLNHRDRSVTGIYARLSHRDKVETFNQLESILLRILSCEDFL